jgi:transcriptional regulator with XRE-family HTH domain
MLLPPQSIPLSPIVRELREIRVAWKMAVERVALQADLGVRTLKYLESGEHEPTLQTLERWADVLGYELVLRPKRVRT